MHAAELLLVLYYTLAVLVDAALKQRAGAGVFVCFFITHSVSLLLADAAACSVTFLLGLPCVAEQPLHC